MTKTTTSTRSVGATKKVLAALFVLTAAAAHAQAVPRGVGLYLEAGQARHHSAETDTLTLGARLPTDVRFFGGQMTLAVDAYVSRWHAEALPGERDRFTQVGLVPMLRWRFDGGRSPWFVEGGIGVSYLADSYRTRTKEFGSRWNFSDHLGVGMNFGPQRRHELGLYVKHVSNAGLASPNPGETFYLLRYGYAL